MGRPGGLNEGIDSDPARVWPDWMWQITSRGAPQVAELGGTIPPPPSTRRGEEPHIAGREAEAGPGGGESEAEARKPDDIP